MTPRKVMLAGLLGLVMMLPVTAAAREPLRTLGDPPRAAVGRYFRWFPAYRSL